MVSVLPLEDLLLDLSIALLSLTPALSLFCRCVISTGPGLCHSNALSTPQQWQLARTLGALLIPLKSPQVLTLGLVLLWSVHYIASGR